MSPSVFQVFRCNKTIKTSWNGRRIVRNIARMRSRFLFRKWFVVSIHTFASVVVVKIAVTVSVLLRNSLHGSVKLVHCFRIGLQDLRRVVQ